MKPKLLSIALVTLGSVLEVYYYYYRFVAEAGLKPMAWIQGIALTLLLMGLFTLRAKWQAWLIIVPLTVFSIYSTATGQKEALTSKLTTEALEVNNSKIEQLESSLELKQRRYDKVESLIDTSVNSFDDTYKWKNTNGKYEEELNELTNDMEELRNQIIELNSPEINQVDKFILQLFFSFFVAIMAPVGILLWPVTRPTDWEYHVRKWVNVNWTGIRNGKSDQILSKDKFLEFLRSRDIQFTEDQYNKIYNVANKLNIVDKNSIIVNNEHEAIKMILGEM